MRLKQFAIMSAASALAMGISGPATAADNPPDYIYTTDQIKVGNAGSECSQLGDLLGKEFVYAYKWNENAGEEAPNGSETANFYDIDNNLEHSNTITISNSTGSVFDWSSSPNGIGAVMVKAGTGYNVYVYDPQAKSDTGLYAYENKAVSHVTFCWNKDTTAVSEWCSPGYWRQDQHLDSWVATGIKPDDTFYSKFGYYPKLSKLGVSAGAALKPTLWQVLQFPQYYGGDAFNAVGDLLSDAHPDVNFTGVRVEDSCPLN